MYYDTLSGGSIQRLLDSFRRQPGVTEDDVRFVRGLFNQVRDENLYYMEGGVYRQLRERGLYDAFEQACRETGVTWTHQQYLD